MNNLIDATNDKNVCGNCGAVNSSRFYEMCHSCRQIAVVKSESRPLPPKPTKALPGTDDKIKVMQDRYAGGYQLWHPRDATLNNVKASDFIMQFSKKP